MQNIVKGFVLTGLACALFACTQTSNKDKPEINAKEEATNASEELVSTCPEIEILEGTGALTAYASSQEKAENVSHQAVIVRSNRKCTIFDKKLTLNIGTAVRVAKGPKLIDEQVVLPIRIVVVRGEGEVLFSQLYNRPVFLSTDEAQEFTITENNISLSAENFENTKVLLGFDTIKKPAQAS